MIYNPVYTLKLEQTEQLHIVTSGACGCKLEEFCCIYLLHVLNDLDV